MRQPLKLESQNLEFRVAKQPEFEGRDTEKSKVESTEPNTRISPGSFFSASSTEREAKKPSRKGLENGTEFVAISK